MAGTPFLKFVGRGTASKSSLKPTAAANDPLGRVPVFAVLSAEVRERVRKKLQHRSVGNGRSVFKAGEPADALYVVQSGRFRVFTRDRYNQEHVLAFAGPGEVLGEAAFMADKPHVTNAEAVEASRVWRLARADFDALLGTEQSVLRYLAAIISRRQTEANARLAAESTPEEARTERGYVTALFSPRGGAGVTTLAIAVGAALAQRHPDDVVLLDLDVLFGTVTANLSMQPKGVLAQAPVSTLQQLDRRGLDYYLIPHESSLRVFPSSVRPEEGEQVTAEQIRAAVSMLKRHFGHLVLDLPHSFSDVTLTGLELADHVLLLATPELTSLRDLMECRRIFTEVIGVPDEKIGYVLNHPHPYAGVPVAEFAAATSRPWEEIAFGGDGPSQAALRGESLVDTRTGNPVSKAAVRFAESITRSANEALALAAG